MLTPFGVAIRKLRLDKGLRLLDTAKAIGKTASFISAVETGKKPIPDGFVEEIARAMGLQPNETAELQRAADRTRAEVCVSDLRGEDRELVAAFARKVHGLSPEEREKLLAEFLSPKTAFKMTGSPFSRRRGFLVPAQNTAQIRGFADGVRSIFVSQEQVAFPIMEVLEFRLQKFLPGFHIDVRSKDEMGGDEGRTIPSESVIEFSEDVYEGAWMGTGRARFTAAHELGHLLLHSRVGLARPQPSDAFPIYRDSEWQADTFAASLLMSPRHIRTFANPYEAAEACQVTYAAAEVTWAKYKQEGILT